MSEGQSQEGPKEKSVDKLGPSNVLDSVFCDGGPMPPAKLSLRGFAFLLDIVLVVAVASIIVWKVVLPQTNPGAFHELMEWSEQVVAWWSAGSTDRSSTPPEASKELMRALRLANELQLLIAWLYFALGEAFFSGTTLGKRIFRLKSVSTITLGPPQFMAGMVRGGMKTIILFWLFPLLLLANFIALFFNKRRQLGHDWMSRTAVVDEKYLSQLHYDDSEA